jgi:1-acyl-sn-glycerol-3-phosphate acyltransferase
MPSFKPSVQLLLNTNNANLGMLKTAFFYLTFWAILIFGIIFFIPYYILKLVGNKSAVKQFVYFISTTWARYILFVNGVKYTAHNKENIPESKSNLVVVSNHQGNFDIPNYISCLP